MQRVVLAVFLVMACTTVAAADSYEEAEFAYDRGNYTHAARLYRPLAEQRIPAAQFHMGLMYERGRGVRQDVVRAHITKFKECD